MKKNPDDKKRLIIFLSRNELDELIGLLDCGNTEGILGDKGIKFEKYFRKIRGEWLKEDANEQDN